MMLSSTLLYFITVQVFSFIQKTLGSFFTSGNNQISIIMVEIKLIYFRFISILDVLAW